MFFTYVLYSNNFHRFYKGHCEDLKQRLKEHNAGKTASTKSFIPWKIIYFESFEILENAIKREKYFKTAAGRRFLKKVLPTFTS
jgi:putative endonuclease